MTDKERIEEQEKPMRIYVDRLPKSCAECIMCRSGNIKLKRNGRYVEANTCVLGLFHKYHSIDDEINTCPLKTIQSIQNQKAVEALERVKYIMLKNIEKNYGFGDKMHHVVDCKKLAIEINNLIKELGGKE